LPVTVCPITEIKIAGRRAEKTECGSVKFPGECERANGETGLMEQLGVVSAFGVPV
jgi:hypothetical protein